MMAELKGKQLLVATILSLLTIGVLGYGNLPEAYCPLEDKTVKYIHMSESHKTVTKVVPSNEGNDWNVMDDRCQKGMQIGQWIPVDKAHVINPECTKAIVIAYTDNGKYFCDDIGYDADCVLEDDLIMPFEFDLMG